MRLTQPQGRRSQGRGRRGSGRGRRGGRSHAWKSPQDGWLLVLEWVKSDPGTVQRMASGNLAANHGGNKIALNLAPVLGHGITILRSEARGPGPRAFLQLSALGEDKRPIPAERDTSAQAA